MVLNFAANSFAPFALANWHLELAKLGRYPLAQLLGSGVNMAHGVSLVVSVRIVNGGGLNDSMPDKQGGKVVVGHTLAILGLAVWLAGLHQTTLGAGSQWQSDTST